MRKNRHSLGFILIMILEENKTKLEQFNAYKEFNKETMEAYNEVEDMINNPDKYKGYDNLDDLWKDLGI